jgi:hypothetical protein
MAAPTFAGISKLEAIAGSGMLLLTWAAATGTTTSYRIYVSTSSDVFNSGSFVQEAPNGATIAKLKVSNTSGNDLINGTLYYIGIRADNNGEEETNTVELSLTPHGGQTFLRTDKPVVMI